MTPAQLVKTTGVPNQRLRLWIEGGLLGDDRRRVGRGNARSYTREDAARVAAFARVMYAVETWRDYIELIVEMGNGL